VSKADDLKHHETYIYSSNSPNTAHADLAFIPRALTSPHLLSIQLNPLFDLLGHFPFLFCPQTGIRFPRLDHRVYLRQNLIGLLHLRKNVWSVRASCSFQSPNFHVELVSCSDQVTKLAESFRTDQFQSGDSLAFSFQPPLLVCQLFARPLGSPRGFLPALSFESPRSDDDEFPLELSVPLLRFFFGSSVSHFLGDAVCPAFI